MIRATPYRGWALRDEHATPAFAQAGFAVVEGVEDRDRCRHWAECCAAMLRASQPIDAAGTRRLLDLPWIEEVVASLRAHAHVVRCLPGGAASIAIQGVYFEKSGETNWLVAMHQDRVFPLATRVVGDTTAFDAWSEKEGVVSARLSRGLVAQLVAVRLHLDDSTADNGPLRVLPGSHRLDLSAARAERGASARKATRVQPASMQADGFECRVGAGGALVMHPLLWHASSKSVNPLSPRRVLHFVFADPTLALPDGAQWRWRV